MFCLMVQSATHSIKKKLMRISWLSRIESWVCLLHNTFLFFGFLICWLWMYLMMLISGKYRAHVLFMNIHLYILFIYQNTCLCRYPFAMQKRLKLPQGYAFRKQNYIALLRYKLNVECFFGVFVWLWGGGPCLFVSFFYFFIILVFPRLLIVHFFVIVYEIKYNHDFIDRGLLLTRKLLNKGLLVVMLTSSLRKCLRSPPLVNRYGISLSQ